MVDFDDHDINSIGRYNPVFDPSQLEGWTVRQPSSQARQWQQVSGIVHGFVWLFPFVMAALVWRAAAGPDGNPLWPALLFTIGMLLLIICIIKGIILPRTWWFAYTDRELIVEHGIFFKARDHVVFDRVQYLERRSGPLMRPRKLAALGLETAAGRANVPAALPEDIDALEAHLRVAMQRAAVV